MDHLCATKIIATVGPASSSPEVLAQLIENGVEYEFKAPSNNWFLSIMGLMLPVILIIGFFVWMQRRAAGQMGNVMSIGRSKAKSYTTDKPSTVDCSLSCSPWRWFMVCSKAWLLSCCSISTRVRSKLLMREMRSLKLC